MCTLNNNDFNFLIHSSNYRATFAITKNEKILSNKQIFFKKLMKKKVKQIEKKNKIVCIFIFRNFFDQQKCEKCAMKQKKLHKSNQKK